MRKNLAATVLTADYLLAVLSTIYLVSNGITDSLLNSLYGVLFLGFIAVFGGVNGLVIGSHWGSFKSAVGKAVSFLSLGLVSWGIGTYIFSGIYNFILQVEVPYPSLADVGYILALPLWAVGMIQLSRATGAKYSMRSMKGKAILFIIPALIILLSYYLLVVLARGGFEYFSDTEILKLVFDLAYPIGDVVILTLATLIFGLSYQYFGGTYKYAINFILLGFVAMYIADFSFSYTTTLETFYTGDWVDLSFTTAVYILSMGLVMFDSKKLSKSEQ